MRKGKRLHIAVRKLWSISSIRFMAYLTLGIWLILGDPFRISSVTGQAINEAYLNIHTLLFPVTPPPLTIVAIDQQSIRDLHGSGSNWLKSDDWPLSYPEHGRILAELMKRSGHRLSGLFYDVFFERPRASSGDLASLNRMVERLQTRTGVPIVFAGGGPDTPLSTASRNILTSPTFAQTNWNAPENTYPLQGSPTNTLAMATPALDMYEALCGHTPACGSSTVEKIKTATRNRTNLAIDWPARASIETGDKRPISCVPICLFSRAWSILKYFFKSIVHGLFGMEGPSHLPPACLPFNVVRLSDVLSNSPNGSLAPPGLKPGAPYIVMVGATIPSLGDYHRTPAYQQVAGIFLHAAAFENLYRMKADFYYHKDFSNWTLGIWALCVVFVMYHFRLKKAEAFKSKVPPWLGYYSMILVTVLGCQLLFSVFLRITTDGWLSLLAILPVLREVVLRREAAFHANTRRVLAW